ncbi:MAG TPA: L,D-transpeptidase [Anaerolineales bacterium]
MPTYNLRSTILNRTLSRRDFLKLAGLGLGGLALRPWQRLSASYVPLQVPSLPEFPKADRLGRVVCLAGIGCNIEVRSRPDPDSPVVKLLSEDTVLPWLHERTGDKPALNFTNQRWVETPEGYIYGPYFQPVANRPNSPLKELPQSSMGPGMWVEVSVPYVDISLENNPSSNSWVKVRMDEDLPLRLYYSQIFWVDQLRTDDQGKVFYRVNPNYYGGVDTLWGAAEAFRPLTADDLAPIRPEAADKRIEVDVTHQKLSCYEGSSEMYYCRVSTGAKFNMQGQVVDKWATPVGEHRVSRKFVSLQMSGGTTGAGYDLPGIGWTTIFATGGVAIHSTFWHNTYGDPVSHGCVNVAPADAQWIFRWTQPNVQADPGMLDVALTGQNSTKVLVSE